MRALIAKNHFSPCLLLVLCDFPRLVPARAQGETTASIVGQVLDASESAIPGATVTITNRETGLRRAAITDKEGRFNFPQLLPGTYSVKVEASAFQSQQIDNVDSPLGQKQTVNFTLKLAESQQSLEVSGEPSLLNPENANTSTNLNAPALENLPNPGGDLTYPLQFAAGALVNTAGSSNDFVGGTNGYGNVEFNGLPALSNGYIVDGLETNDPLTNLNSGLSTNLVLGLNSVSEVTVNTLSYSVDQGRYGASQVDYVTKSGSNQFHGNLYELWNGSRFNAADFFTNATAGNHKPRSTVNHFGGSLGGPIVHDKLFFFFDSEWVRIALPIVTSTLVPSAGIPAVCPAAASPRSNHRLRVQRTGQKLFPRRAPVGPVLSEDVLALWKYQRCSPTRLTAVRSRRARVARTSRAFRTPVTTTSRYKRSASTTTSTQNDTAWLRLQSDTGLQAAWTDPINPVFNAFSPQPLYSFAAGYTHVFSQNLVNYFNPAFSWYESLFAPGRFSEARSPRFPSCSQEPEPIPSQPSEDWTIPGYRAGAPPASL